MIRRFLLSVLVSLSLTAAAEDELGKPTFSFRALLSDWEPTRDREERQAELLFASVAADWKAKGWGVHLDLRGREGKFRPYFPSSVWLEEGYAFVETPVGQLRAGKVPRVLGAEDVTFAGNLFSLNGVSRNPDYGASVVGVRGFGYDTLSWTVSYFGQNDRVAWEEDGRGVESDPGSKLRDAFSGRAGYKWNQGLTSLTPGVSAETARVVAETGGEFRRTDLALDLTGTLGPLALTGAWLARRGLEGASRSGYGDATAGLVEFRAEFPTILYRYTYSEWTYRGPGASERIHQPGVVWTPVRGLEATIEYVGRRYRTASEVKVRNGFQLGLALKL